MDAPLDDEQDRQVAVRSTSELRAAGLARVTALLRDAFGEELTDDDVAHSLGGHHVLLLDDDGSPVAHAAVVPRRLHVGDASYGCGYLEAVAVRPDLQRAGLGTQVLRIANALVAEHHQVGALSTGEHGFYERSGWVRWHGPAYVVRGGVWVRAAEEDDAVMVLDLGRSDVVLDRGARIAVDDRPGDAW